MKLTKMTILAFSICTALALTGCGITITAGYHENKEIVEEEAIPDYDREQLEAEIDKLETQLLDNNDEKEIAVILESFYNASELKIEAVYFSDNHGKFYLFPELPMPEDYDARARPWYNLALEQELYILGPYHDVDKVIVTITKAVYETGEASGVAGMDIIIN